MQISVDEIKIKKRVRKDLGNLEPLKDSLRRYGLLNPITINSQYELVAGHRRLEAAKSLGWSTIDAIIVDSKDKVVLLEMELEENTQRKEFTDAELLEGYESLEKLRNPGFFTKLWQKIVAIFQKTFDSKEAHKIEKIKKNGLRAIFLPVGLIIIILAAISSKKGFISIPLHNVLDITGFIFLLIGIFYFIKFIIGKSK